MAGKAASLRYLQSRGTPLGKQFAIQLATPRGSAAVDDALMAGAASKIFKLPPKQRV